jgi:hypothetical protein
MSKKSDQENKRYAFNCHCDTSYDFGFVFLYSKKLFVYVNDSYDNTIQWAGTLMVEKYSEYIFQGEMPERDSIYFVIMGDIDDKWFVIPVMQIKNIDIERLAFEDDFVEFLWLLVEKAKDLYSVEVKNVPVQFEKYLINSDCKSNKLDENSISVKKSEPKACFTPPYARKNGPTSREED